MEKKTNGKEITVKLSEEQYAELLKVLKQNNCPCACLFNDNTVKLSEVKEGEIIKTGKYEWIVLEHSAETTALILSDILPEKKRFDSSSNDWVKSSLRKWLNEDFASELFEEIGKENIIAHTPCLDTDDGTPNYKADKKKDYVSLLSADKYRKFRKYIKPLNHWWWTLTPLSSEVGADCVRVVDYVVTLNYDFSNCYYGVRPFIILKSNIFVYKKEN